MHAENFSVACLLQRFWLAAQVSQQVVLLQHRFLLLLQERNLHMQRKNPFPRQRITPGAKPNPGTDPRMHIPRNRHQNRSQGLQQSPGATRVSRGVVLTKTLPDQRNFTANRHPILLSQDYLEDV